MQSATSIRALSRELRRQGFQGSTIEPGDSGYAAARRVWNGTVDRYPALIARPRTRRDVAAAVQFARAQDLPLAIRGGGHSIAGHSTCDHGVVVDLAELRRVSVDPVKRRARVGGGALLGDLDRASQAHGLAVPAGQVSHTGVGGLTLGGGIGYLTRAHGLTIDSLLSAEVVTAAGEIVRASAEVHPDLFWGLRGGGGNFGIVTEFEFALHDVGPLVYAGVFAFPFERAGEILRASRDLMADAAEELSIHEILITVPSHEPFPPELQGRRAVFLVPVHVGGEGQARADLAPLRRLGPSFDLVGPMPYLALQSMIDHDNRAGLGHHSRSHWLAGYEDQLIDLLIEHFAQAPSPLAHVVTARMGGAVTRVPADATAFRHREAANLLWIIGYWPDPDDDAAPHRAWVDGLFDAAAPFSTGGVYVNGLENEGPERVRAAYGGETFARLAALKQRWDPENVFRLNHNIPPSADALAVSFA
jgi:FAD/FMN-containing dehydrogenase